MVIGVTSETGWLAVAVLMLVCLTRAYSIRNTKSKGWWEGKGKIDDDCWGVEGGMGVGVERGLLKGLGQGLVDQQG